MMNVSIRQPELTDCKEFVELMKCSKATLQPWVTPPETEKSYIAFCERANRGDTQKGFLLCLLPKGEIIGVINLNLIVMGGFKSAYLGYYIGSEYQGKGYMSAGLGLVIKHAFSTVKLHRLEANIQPGNARSIRLVQRLGFHIEGVSLRYLKINGRWRDHLRWAITVEDWREMRKGRKFARESHA